MLQIKLLADCEQHLYELAKLQFQEISRHWVPDATVEKTAERLGTHLNRETLPFTLVALYDHKPIGMASLRENDGIRPDLMPWLGSLVVHPSYRLLKIGETLIDAIKKQAQAYGYPNLYLLAFDATIPTWYTKLGWQTIGTDQLFGHPVTVMEINL